MAFQNSGFQPSPYSPTQTIATAPKPSAVPMPGFNMPMPQPNIPMGSPPGGWSQPNMIYPPGLEYLMALDHLFMKQKLELLEAITGFETKNKYSIVNIRGEPVFHVAEKSGCCARCCLGSYRPCEFSIFDNNRREVLHMVRPFRSDSCCCPCFLQELEVYSGDTLLGSVTQDWTLWRPVFSVRDASGETVLKIEGPCCRWCFTAKFRVKSLDGEHKVGSIKKEWSGLAKEVFTDVDNFGISFPLDLDVKIKAVLLGACILIDFMFFEGNSRNNAGDAAICCLNIFE